MPLAEQFWGARYGAVRDPFGHSWSLATQVRKVSQAERDDAAKRLVKADSPASGRASFVAFQQCL